MLKKIAFAAATSAAISALTTSPCLAFDYQPFDWVPLPQGTNVLMGYYQYASRNSYNSTLFGTVKKDTNLDSELGIGRYLYYNKIFNHDYVLDLVVPFGGLTGGKIANQRLNSASGFSDPLMSAGVWLISDPKQKRYVSAASFVTVPIGNYDRHKTLNLGGNRWVHDLQVDYTQGLTDKITLDVSGDWTYYGDNTQAGPTGAQTLTENSSYSAYAWITYDVTSELKRIVPSALPASVSVGYLGEFGGVQKIGGMRDGGKTEEQAIRASYTQMLTPTLQGIISVNHDVESAGQFNERFALLARVAKLF